MSPAASPGATSGENDKAIADLDQSIALDPQNPDAYGVRGDAWADKKDFDKAIADFSRVLRLDRATRGPMPAAASPRPSGSNTTRPSPTSIRP